jgi:hypothetical protein
VLIFLCVLLAVARARAPGSDRPPAATSDQRTTLEARRADLERQIRVACRPVLVPIAEQELGLHLPSDSEFTLLVLPPAGRAGADYQAQRPHRGHPVRLRGRDRRAPGPGSPGADRGARAVERRGRRSRTEKVVLRRGAAPSTTGTEYRSP